MHPLTPLPLRDHVLNSFASLPGTRELQLDVLVTPPKKTSSLFPYARPKVRGWVQEVLLLLFESVPSEKAEARVHGDEGVGMSVDQDGQESVKSRGTRKACVAALEAYLYHLPSTRSAILYISKVDSSGLALSPSPTSVLARSFLSHLCSAPTRPAETLWVHVFARSQGQYLFPNSSENGRKRVLGDARLCAWWKGLLEQVVRDVVPEARGMPRAELVPLTSKQAGGSANEGVESAGVTAVHIPPATEPPEYAAFFLLPGYSYIEASRLLLPSTPTAHPQGPPIDWTYSHPYTSDVLPYLLPFPHPAGTAQSASGLAGLVPSFEDDPKARFIVELASDVQPDMPRKRSKIGGGPPGSPTKRGQPGNANMLASPKKVPSEEGESGSGSKEKEKEKEREREKDMGPTSEERALARTGVDDFWELMPHRQECSSGAVTGFFVLVFPPSTDPSRDEEHVPWGTTSTTSSHPSAPASMQHTELDLPAHPQPQQGQVSQPVLSRVRQTLLDLEFGNVDAGYRSSAVLEELVRKCCGPTLASTTAATGDGPQSQELPHAAAGEPKDIYSSFISASIALRNPLLERKEVVQEQKPAVVNVLQVKKKKRAAPV